MFDFIRYIEDYKRQATEEQKRLLNRSLELVANKNDVGGFACACFMLADSFDIFNLIMYQISVDSTIKNFFSNLGLIHDEYISFDQVNLDMLLLETAKTGNVNAMQFLIEKRADVDARDCSNRTPLIFATMNGDLEKMRFLLQHGANVDLLDREEKTAFNYARDKKSLPHIKLLIDYNACILGSLEDVSQLHLTVLANNLQRVEELLNQNKSLLFAIDKLGRTPLHYASERGYLRIVKYLIQQAEKNEIIGLVNMVESELGSTPLHFATRKAHFSVIQYLIEKGANVNAQYRSEKGVFCSSLFVAIWNERYDIAEYLIRQGANLFIENQKGEEISIFDSIEDKERSNNMYSYCIKQNCNFMKYTKNVPQLHKLVLQGKEQEVIEHLNVNPSDLLSVDANDRSLLFYASEMGCIALVQFLIERASDLIDMPDNQGQTPLFRAVYKEHDSVVDLLLSNGANVNAQYRSEKGVLCSSLFVAIWNKRYYIAKHLISQGANLFIENQKGEEIPIFDSIEDKERSNNMYSYCIKQNCNFMKYTKNVPQLHKLVLQGKWQEVIEHLNANSSDLLSVDANNRSLLFYASEMGCIALVQFLIERAYDLIDMPNNQGQTPLFRAVYKEHGPVVDLLLNSGAKVNAKNKQGVTPLMMTDRHHRANIASSLIKQGAKVNLADNEDVTALHRAVKFGSLNVADLLIQKGAYIDAKNNKGNTALHYASSLGNLSAVMYLVGNGANINATNNTGETPCDVAYKYQQCTEVFNYLSFVKKSDKEIEIDLDDLDDEKNHTINPL